MVLQIPFSQESALLTTFITPFGRYCWKQREVNCEVCTFFYPFLTYCYSSSEVSFQSLEKVHVYHYRKITLLWEERLTILVPSKCCVYICMCVHVFCVYYLHFCSTFSNRESGSCTHVSAVLHAIASVNRTSFNLKPIYIQQGLLMVFHRLPFGITSAPEHFQHRMSDLLSDLDGVVCIIEDVLVHGRTAKEHDKRLVASSTDSSRRDLP